MKNQMKLTRWFGASFVLAGLLLAMLAVGGEGWRSSSVHAESAAAPAMQPATDDGQDGNEGPDVPITGDALEAASAAALDYIGEGRVTDTEVGDEEGFYEVEITRDNGREVDVHLDEAFNVLGHEDD